MSEIALIKRKRRIRLIKDTILVILGTAILAIGAGLFIIPFGLVTGGVSGLGIIFERLFRDLPMLGEITADVWASILVWALFFVGLIFLGKKFAIQTLVSTIVYPIVLMFASWLAESNIAGGFFNLTSPMYAGYGGVTIILAVLFGGASFGVGCALTFLGGGSTGGSDIIPLTICKFFPKLKSSVMIFVTDGAIVLFGMFVSRDIVLTLLGIVAAFICAIAIDKIFLGGQSALIAQVVSDKYSEISAQVIRQMNRTTTVSTVEGGFSHTEKKLLMCTFAISQYSTFIAIVSSIDKNAFVTVHRAHEISGDGWTYNIEDEYASIERDALRIEENSLTSDTPLAEGAQDQTARDTAKDA
ncbi:MAG: YitT family protein [Clostridia bacterium]|nr:YitT family protein [Clostridia bacterium]